MTTPGLEVRPLTPAEVVPLQERMPSWNASEYARRLAAQERGVMVQAVAWDGPLPVGRGMVLFPGHEEWSISAHRERCAEVRDVAVAETYRRRGIARALMALLEAEARDVGMPRIGLSVSVDAAPARALYDALGYRPAHGPFITSTVLEDDDGRPMPVGAVMLYLTKEL